MTTAPDQGGGFALNLGGRVTVEHFTYFDDLGDDRAGGRNSVDFALEAEAKSERVTALGRLLIRHDFSNDRRDRLEAEEVYIETRLGRLTARAGRVIVNWGTANLVNPTDVVNQVDLRDPLDAERRGTWMVRAGMLLGPVLIEGYYLPVPEANLMPFPDAISPTGEMLAPWRWLPPIEPPPPGVEVRAELRYNDPPPTTLANTQAALRIAASLSGVDFSLGYMWRFDPMPTTRQTAAFEPPPPAQPTAVDFLFETEFHRLHMITLDGETTLGKLRLATEALIVLTEDLDNTDDDIVNPYISAVFGVDYRTGQFFDDHQVHLFADVWITQLLVGEQSANATNLLRFPFEYALLARARYELGESLRIDLNVITALDRYDLLLNPAIEYLLFDRVTLEAGFMVLMGNENKSFFGLYPENSRFMASAEVAF